MLYEINLGDYGICINEKEYAKESLAGKIIDLIWQDGVNHRVDAASQYILKHVYETMDSDFLKK